MPSHLEVALSLNPQKVTMACGTPAFRFSTDVLVGRGLDWAVAHYEGFHFKYDRPFIFLQTDADDWRSVKFELTGYSPSTDPIRGHQIIHNRRIALSPILGEHWAARIQNLDPFEEWIECTGPDALIAAMRCRVAREAGEFIDIPQKVFYA